MMLLLSKRGAVPREVYFPSCGFLFKKKSLKGRVKLLTREKKICPCAEVLWVIWCPELRLTGAELLMGEEGSICPHPAHSRADTGYEVQFSS